VTGLHPPSTRTEEVYRPLRADLLAGQFEPAQWVKISDLQKRFGTSPTTVREALNRLVAEGLLVYVPQHGFRVIELSLAELRELTDARVRIETLVLRDSLTFGDSTWEAALVGAHHHLDHTPLWLDADRATLNPDWLVRHTQFHEVLLAGCSNRRLRAIANSLRDTAELYRLWSPLPRLSSSQVAADHKRLTELALSRDVEQCVQLLADHIGHTRRALDRPDTAAGGDGKAPHVG